MERYYWLNRDSRNFLSKDYLINGQTAEERIREIANTAEAILGINGFADEFEDYMAQGFYSLSTPIWINFGNNRGLPISCFGSYIDDSVESFLLKQAEVGMMTKAAGGTSGYFGDIRPRGSRISTGGQAEGPVRAMELFHNVTEIISQGSARRGHFAAYLPIEHPDLDEFLKINEVGHVIQEMSIGVCVSDEFMNKLISRDKETIKIWGKVIKKRCESGYPYIFFTDTINENKPQIYKDLDYKIVASNMCSEICLPSSPSESFVCDLSSINAERWGDIKRTRAVKYLVYLLDAAMTEFIEKSKDMVLMKCPRRFAINHRAVGVGMLGWHSLLQSKMIPFESMEAKLLNSSIWKEMREQTDIATQELATLLGEAPLLKGKGRRNTTTLAIAPTTSSSFILGQVSPSIEPLDSNYFVKDLAKGKYTYKNPYLVKLLKEKDKNTAEVWHSILSHGGSVQHLDFLSEIEKDVFKTFGEISQKEIIIQAAQRQKHIDQSQSLNLKIPHTATPKEINELIIFAWQQKVKTLYYQRSSNPSKDLARNLLNCKSCEA